MDMVLSFSRARLNFCMDTFDELDGMDMVLSFHDSRWHVCMDTVFPIHRMHLCITQSACHAF